MTQIRKPHELDVVYTADERLALAWKAASPYLTETFLNMQPTSLRLSETRREIETILVRMRNFNSTPLGSVECGGGLIEQWIKQTLHSTIVLLETTANPRIALEECKKIYKKCASVDGILHFLLVPSLSSSDLFQKNSLSSELYAAIKRSVFDVAAENMSRAWKHSIERMRLHLPYNSQYLTNCARVFRIAGKGTKDPEEFYHNAVAMEMFLNPMKEFYAKKCKQWFDETPPPTYDEMVKWALSCVNDEQQVARLHIYEDDRLAKIVEETLLVNALRPYFCSLLRGPAFVNILSKSTPDEFVEVLRLSDIMQIRHDVEEVLREAMSFSQRADADVTAVMFSDIRRYRRWAVSMRDAWTVLEGALSQVICDYCQSGERQTYLIDHLVAHLHKALCHSSGALELPGTPNWGDFVQSCALVVRSLSNKQEFAQCYRGNLAIRLLSFKASIAEEEGVLMELQQHLTDQWDLLSGMLHDFKSQDHCNFIPNSPDEWGGHARNPRMDESTEKNHGVRVDFGAYALGVYRWPHLHSVACPWIPSIQLLVDEVDRTMSARRNERTLTWHPSCSRGEVVVHLREKKVNVACNGPQAYALCLLGHGPCSPAKATEHGIPPETMKDLVGGKRNRDACLVLLQQDGFAFNRNFKGPRSQNLPIGAVLHSDAQRQEDNLIRSKLIQCAIVRVMKANNKMTMGELFDRVKNMLCQRFTLELRSMKIELDALMDLQYFKREKDAQGAQVFVYVT